MSGTYVLKMTEGERLVAAASCAAAYGDRSCRGCYLDGYCPRVSEIPETPCPHCSAILSLSENGPWCPNCLDVDPADIGLANFEATHQIAFDDNDKPFLKGKAKICLT